MATNPLSYGSLKCVLQHMDANKRIHVSRCCPSIWTAERATPLKINLLEFKPGKIKINCSTYFIGTYKHFHVGVIPEALKVENDEGGVLFGVDKFGIRDWNDSAILTPGDVEIGRQFRDERQREYDGLWGSIEILERYIQSYEQSIISGPNSDEFRRQQQQPFRAKLVPLLLKRDNAPPPFENLIQLNVTSEGSNYIKRCMHPKKYHEAVKQLGELLFGGRKQLIHVIKFRLFDYQFVIRVPLGVKFYCKSIQFPVSVNTVYSQLSPIIHESSYPLEHVHVMYSRNEDVANGIVRNSKKVTIFFNQRTVRTIVGINKSQRSFNN